MLHLFFLVNHKNCNAAKIQELEMNTDSLYLAIIEQGLYDCIRPALRKEWDSLRSGEVEPVPMAFQPVQKNVFVILAALSIKNTRIENLASLEKD